MMHVRLAAMAALVLAAGVATATPAFAAAPTNDTYAGRTVVSGLPFSDQVDTTGATTDADDDAIAAQCLGVPAYDATVWYAITPASDTGVVVDVSGSSYSAGVFVATGSPGNWALVACGPGATGWSATAGTAYFAIAFDDQTDGSGNGGVLNITIDASPPPPTIDLTVDTLATFNATTGSATVTGTVICSGETQYSFLEVQLSQTVGRFIIKGYGSTEVTCDGAKRPWSVIVTGDNGTFARGEALSATFATACGVFDCGVDFEERMLRLRRERP